MVTNKFYCFALLSQASPPNVPPTFPQPSPKAPPTFPKMPQDLLTKMSIIIHSTIASMGLYDTFSFVRWPKIGWPTNFYFLRYFTE